MKPVVPSPVRRSAAFTMVELALCIAIIAIAMVAIMGVLPAGMGVQKQNREDTIISQEATHWMEVLRGGAVLFDDVTNYVDFVAVGRQRVDDTRVLTNFFVGPYFTIPASSGLSPVRRLNHPELILGLLSLPKYDTIPNDFVANPTTVTNTITAVVRAFSGSLNEKILPQAVNEQPSNNQLGFSFRYLLRVELIPVPTLPKDATPTSVRQFTAIERGLFDVRLTFEWPVVGQDFNVKSGANLRTYRTQVAAQNRYQRDTNGNILKAPGSSINLRQLTPAATRLPVL